MKIVAGCFDLCAGVFECGKMILAKGLCDSSRNRPIVGTCEKVIGISIILLAGLATFVTGQGNSHTEKEGELWEGRFFPYKQYPHGHLDCNPEMTEYDPARADENESLRKMMFWNDKHEICTRGSSTLLKIIGKKIVHCFSNGTTV